MSDRAKGPTSKRKLTRAELKAYRSRREAERHRIAAQQAEAQGEAPAPQPQRVSETSYMLTRNDEFTVIRQDLVRLMYIVALLLFLLIAATVVLR